MSYFRFQPADRDPQALLDPAQQISRVWIGVAEVACSRCDQWDADPDCCECAGDGVRYVSQQSGVSTCESLDDLIRYAVHHAADFGAPQALIELDGEPADEEDIDASDGAILVRPTAIVAVTPITDEWLAEHCLALNADYQPVFND